MGLKYCFVSNGPDPPAPAPAPADWFVFPGEAIFLFSSIAIDLIVIARELINNLAGDGDGVPRVYVERESVCED